MSRLVPIANVSPRGKREQLLGTVMECTPLELEVSLSDRKIELADIETVKGYVEELRNLLESTWITERKSFIKSFVKEVRVTSSEVSLDYTPQLLEGMMSRETFLVPPIVQRGGRYWI